VLLTVTYRKCLQTNKQTNRAHTH